MDLISTITYGLIGALVVFVVSAMNNASNKSILTKGRESYVIKMNLMYLILGIASLCISAFFIIVSGMLIQEIDGAIACGLMALIFAAVGIPFVLLYKNHKVAFDLEHFTLTNWKGKSVSFNWTEVKNVKNNSFTGYITITGDGKSAKVHKHISGLFSFLIYLENTTSWTTKDLNSPFHQNR